MQTRYLILSAMLVTTGLAGCATNKGLSEGRALIAAGQAEAGIARIRAGLDEDPNNLELKIYYHTQRERLVSQWLTQAQLDMDAERFDAAQTALKQALDQHPENPRALAMLGSLALQRQHQQSVSNANQALAAGRLDEAEYTARQVLLQSPRHVGALTTIKQIQQARLPVESSPNALGAAFRKPITLEFREAPLRSVFDLISRQSGINFIFDKDMRLDTKATLFARNTPIADAIDMLLLTGQLEKKVMNANTLLIYPDLPQKQKLYQELMVKSFYLGNADAKSSMIMLKTLLKMRDIHVDDRLNLLVIRDTPEAIRLAEKIIAAQDLAEPEVMLDVEVLEVKRGRLLDLGVQYPSQFSLLNLPPSTTTSLVDGIVTNTTPSAPVLTIDSLRHIARSDIAISPTPAVNFRKDNSDVNILANPRIRVKNREKAKIHIGDKVPVITSNTTATGVVSESVSYLDVGLKLDVEPSVLMREDVQIKVGLEVSNIVREIRSNSGTLTYQIGTRNAGTTLRLKDGETQVLAGLISDEDRSSSNRIPGLGDIPLLGRLFSNQRDERSKTEIVLLITPRILRSDASRLPVLTEFRGGTENAIGGFSFPSFISPVNQTFPVIPAPSTLTGQSVSPSAEINETTDQAPEITPGIFSPSGPTN